MSRTSAPCAVTECDRPKITRGWCSMHYRRWKVTGTTDGTQSRTCLGCSETFVGSGRRGWVHKMCPTCRDLYFRCDSCPQLLPKTSTRRYGRCTTCERDRKLRSLYGITLAEFTQRLADQGNCCAICRTPATPNKHFRVDHDHACCPGTRSCRACVRGIICDLCNRGIGFMQDDPESLRRAADYIERFKAAQRI